MNKVVKIFYHNAVYFRFRITDNEIYRKIDQRFTYQKQVWKNRKLSNQTFKLVYNSNKLYNGLLDDLLSFLDEEEISYEVDKRLSRKSRIDEASFDRFVENLNLILTPHYYQKESVKAVLESRNNIILSPTSSGKSLIISMIIMAYLNGRKDNKKVLIVVPDKGLVSQMYYNLIEYFEKNKNIDIKSLCQMIHGDIPKKKRDYNKPVIITTWSSQKNTNETFEKLFDSNFLEQVGCLIYDEVHESIAKVAKKIVTSCHNTVFRVGLTGSLHEEEDELKNIQIQGMFGDVISSISTREMIDGGFSADVDIYHLIFNYGIQRKMSYVQELEFVEEDESLLNYMVNFIGQTKTGNGICLYRHVRYAKKFMNKMKKLYPHKKIFRVDKDTSAEERKRIFKYIENNDNVLLMGTYRIISTGLSIKRLHYAFMLQGIKKKIKTIQALGRILRLHDSKKKAKLFDFVPKIVYLYVKSYEQIEVDGYLYKHFKKRVKTFTQEGHNYKIKVIKNWK